MGEFWTALGAWLWTTIGTVFALMVVHMTGFGDFFLGLLEHGAWPALIGFLAIRFGKQVIETVKYIAENFRSGKFGPFEIIMTEKMADATDAAEEAGISTEAAEEVGISMEAADEVKPNEDLPSVRRQRARHREREAVRRARLGAIAEYPVATILVKYAEVEDALREAVVAHNLEKQASTASGKVIAARAIDVLSKHKRITVAEWNTLKSLNSIRNNVAHARPKDLETVDIDFAANFVRLADGVIERLKLVAQPSRETSTDETP